MTHDMWNKTLNLPWSFMKQDVLEKMMKKIRKKFQDRSGKQCDELTNTGSRVASAPDN